MRTKWRLMLTVMLCLCAGSVTVAQINNVWVMGAEGPGINSNHARDKVDFNGGSPPVATPFTHEVPPLRSDFAAGNASVCDEQGQLLFYTDGTYIWDRNGALMPNGQDLTAESAWGIMTITSVSHQGSQIVPMPDTTGVYYVFSLANGVSTIYTPINDSVMGFYFGPPNSHLYYSIIDMNLNNGLGDVAAGQKGILVDSGLKNALAVITGNHCNVWVLSMTHGGDFHVYEVNDVGISDKQIFPSNFMEDSMFTYHGGIIAVSPDKSRIAASRWDLTHAWPLTPVHLFDFDPETGIVSNELPIAHYTGTGINTYALALGLSFSPDNNKLYVASTFSGILQYDLSSNDSILIGLSQIQIGGTSGLQKLRLGPDQKIYFMRDSYDTVNIYEGTCLGVINYPNLSGTDCGLNLCAVPLNNRSGIANEVPVVNGHTETSTLVDAPCFTTDTSIALNAAVLDGWSYAWSTGAYGPGLQATASGTYWVSYRTPPCIRHVDTFHVNFGSYLPSVHTDPGCRNESNSKAWVSPFPVDTITYTYTWYNASGQVLQGPLASNQGDTLLDLAYNAGYRVQVVAPNGCDTTFFFTIPTPDYQASFSLSDSLLCLGQALAIQNTSSGDIDGYSWDWGDGHGSADQDPAHTYTQPGSYNIRLIIQTPYPCYDTATVEVSVYAMPSPSFTISRDSICTGESITFSPQADSSVIRLSWDFADAGYMLSPVEVVQHAYDQAGDMPVTLTAHSIACPDTAFAATVHVYPPPEVNLGLDTSLCLDGHALMLHNLVDAPQEGHQYLWNTGDTTANLRVLQPGTYSLRISAEPLGCTTTDEIEVRKDCYMDIPNAFTPNGDGDNDYFFSRTRLSKSVSSFKMQVFNRWGQLVFETTSIDGRGWDGRFNDKEQPMGVYIYVLEASYINGRQETYKGNVTLVR